MAYKIIWAPEAERTFDEIIEYLTTEWTEREIKIFIRETEKTISIVSKNPFLFRNSEKEGVHEAVIMRKNLLFYDVSRKEKEIELLLFWQTQMNPDSKPFSK